jgi:putative oxidoreductase
LVLTGVFEGVGGAALVFGVYARVAAGALALFTVFVSLVFVRFWSFRGPPEMHTMLKNTFVGNVAITGGLVYIAVLGPGGLALADR